MTSWRDWSDAIADGVRAVPDSDLRRAAEIILAADLVVCAGNGGSASLASHAAQAIMKPSYGPGGGRAAVALADSIPTMTAHANDGGWERALEESARPFLSLCEAHDLRGDSGRERPLCGALVVFSSSGKSRNVLHLAASAVGYRVPIIAFTGFDGGPLRSLATVSLHVDSDSYEVIEPTHDAWIHRIQQHLRGAVIAAPP